MGVPAPVFVIGTAQPGGQFSHAEACVITGVGIERSNVHFPILATEWDDEGKRRFRANQKVFPGVFLTVY
jgi:hypothetical protein